MLSHSTTLEKYISLEQETTKTRRPDLTPNELEAQRSGQPSIHGDGEEEKNDTDGGDTSGRILVDWDGEDDPANPLNWSKTKRISQVVLISAITMLTWVSPCNCQL